MIEGTENRIVLKSGTVKHEGYIVPANTSTYYKIEAIEKKLKSYLDENQGKSLIELDRKVIRGFARDMAGAIIVFDKGLPDLSFFMSDEFEFQTLDVAKTFFLAWFRLS